MKAGLVTLVDRWAEISKQINVLATNRVMVGVPEDKTARTDGGPTNAQLAYIHDTGAPEANIPARPFMRPGIERKRAEITDRLKSLGKAVLEGADAEHGLAAVGLIAQASIRGVIQEGIPPPLAESTIEGRIRKKSRSTRKRGALRAQVEAGETLFTPLIVTGQLLKSVTYVIRKVTRR